MGRSWPQHWWLLAGHLLHRRQWSRQGLGLHLLSCTLIWLITFLRPNTMKDSLQEVAEEPGRPGIFRRIVIWYLPQCITLHLQLPETSLVAGRPSPGSEEQQPSCFHFSLHFRRAFIGLGHLARRCRHSHRFLFGVHFSWQLLFLEVGLHCHWYFQERWAHLSRSPSWTARGAPLLSTHWMDCLFYHPDFYCWDQNLDRWTHSWRSRH